MPSLNEISNFLEGWAPLSLQESWDKSGFQIYLKEEGVDSVLLAMDITPRVIQEAIDHRAQLIITHHPFIFQPIQSLDYRECTSKMLLSLLNNKISVYSAHTNMDKAQDGVNDQWIEKLSLGKVETLDHEDEIGIIGYLDISLNGLVERLKGMGLARLRGYGAKKQNIKKVAVVGGSGSDYIQVAKNRGADLLITGDMTHHKGQEAFEIDLMVIDVGHFDSEKFILARMNQRLKEEFPRIEVNISKGCDFVFDL